MSGSKSLPARPSLESLRKQAKKLAREVAAGDATAVARARAHLPNADLPLTQRSAQLVIAREYGYAGWRELTGEVGRRIGNGVEWAASQARRAIHDYDVERLTKLLAEYPALLSWRGDEDGGGLLGFATIAWADAGDPQREHYFTRVACAEALIDAGAVVSPPVLEGILVSRAKGMLQLFERKGLLPRTLEFLATLGDVDAVRGALAESANDLTTVNAAFVRATSFQHEAVASLLLDRSIALDPELGKRVDASVGRSAFVAYYIDKRPAHAPSAGLWKAFVMEQVSRAVQDGELTAFVSGVRRESWLLGDDCVDFQSTIIGNAAMHGRGEVIVALLELEPAILRRQPPPPSQAIELAVTYAHTELIPVLTRIWPLPDDLPYAAAMGNLAHVKHWFDDSGVVALGNPDDHYPLNDARARGNLRWNPPSVQQVLDTALAFAVINKHFDVADFLLDHGADINTSWGSHEPASILHQLVFQENSYDAMQYVIDRGIDMTITDYRWNSTARGWAFHAAKDERMAAWLDDAELRQSGNTRRA
jgi:hypothetical protein